MRYNRILGGVIFYALALLSFSVAAQTTRSSMNAYNNQYITTNGRNAITGAIMHNLENQIINNTGVLNDTNPWTGQNSFILNPAVQSAMNADGAVVTVQNSTLTSQQFLSPFLGNTVFYDNIRSIMWNDVGSNLGDAGAVTALLYNTNPRHIDPTSGKVITQNNGVAFTGYAFCAAANTWCWIYDFALTDQDLQHNHYPTKLLGEIDVNVFDSGTTPNPFSIIANFHVQPAGGVALSVGNIGTGPYGFFTALNVGQGSVAPGHDAINYGSIYTPPNAPYLPFSTAPVTTGTGCTAGAGVGTFSIIGGTQSFWASGPTTVTVAYDSLRLTYSATVAAGTTYTTPPTNPVALSGSACTLTMTWAQGSDSQTIAYGFLTSNISAHAPITFNGPTGNGVSGCSLGTYNIPGGTLATNYPSPASVTITQLDANGGISDGSVYPFGITVTAASGYLPSAVPTNPITLSGTGCSSNPSINITWGPASDVVENWVTPALTASPSVFWRDLITGGVFDVTLAGANMSVACGNAALATVNCNYITKNGYIGLSPYARMSIAYTVAPSVSAANPPIPSANGTGGVNGTAVYTVSGGTCTTQPQLNVTWSAGVLAVNSVAAAGSCATLPASPATLTYTSGTATGWTGATVVLNSTTPLPTCNAGQIGAFAYVIDALTPTLGGSLVGGGAVNVFAGCAGANGWKAI